MPESANVMSLIENTHRPSRNTDVPDRFQLTDERSGDRYPLLTPSIPEQVNRQAERNVGTERTLPNDNSPDHTIDASLTRVIDIETAPTNEVDRITKFANDVAAATLNVVEMHNAKFPKDQRKGFRYETPPRSGNWHEVEIKETRPIKGDPGRNIYIIEMTPLETNTDIRQAKKKQSGTVVLRVEDASPKITQPIGRASVNVTGCGVVEEKGKRRQIIRAEEVEDQLTKHAPLPARPRTNQPAANVGTNVRQNNGPNVAPQPTATQQETQHRNPVAPIEQQPQVETRGETHVPTRAQIREILSRRDNEVTDTDLELLAARSLADQRALMRLQTQYRDPNTAPARLLPLAAEIYEIRAQMREVEAKRRTVIDVLINYDPSMDRMRNPRQVLNQQQATTAQSTHTPTADTEQNNSNAASIQRPAQPQTATPQRTPQTPIVIPNGSLSAPDATTAVDKLRGPKPVEPNLSEVELNRMVKEADRNVNNLTNRLRKFAKDLTQESFDSMRDYIENNKLPEDPRKLLAFLQRQELVLTYVESRLSNDGAFIRNINNLTETAIAMDPEMDSQTKERLKKLQEKLTFGNPNNIDPYDVDEFMWQVNRSVNGKKSQNASSQNGNTSNQRVTATPANTGSNQDPRRPQIIANNNGNDKKDRRIPQTQDKVDDPRVGYQPKGIGYQKGNGSTGSIKNKRDKVLNGN